LAEHLNAVMLKTGIWAGLLGVLFALLAASAENLTDPTRPPAGFGKNQAADAVASVPVLQSILISPTRKIAIISGKTLKAGDKLGDAQLVTIGENEVVLRTGKQVQVLKLYPSLRKQALNSRAGGELDGRGQHK
jgi:MSHA biogenesis protein MshK